MRPPQDGRPEIADQRHLTSLWWVFLQLLAAMVMGTVATGIIFASVIGLGAYGQVTVLYPAQILLAMAAGMRVEHADTAAPGLARQSRLLLLDSITSSSVGPRTTACQQTR